MTNVDQPAAGFGANSWLVEEMYEQFRDDPDSVSAAWREFFDDYRPFVAATPSVTAVAAVAVPAVAAAEPVGEEPGEPIRGAGVAIVDSSGHEVAVGRAGVGHREPPS